MCMPSLMRCHAGMGLEVCSPWECPGSTSSARSLWSMIVRQDSQSSSPRETRHWTRAVLQRRSCPAEGMLQRPSSPTLAPAPTQRAHPLSQIPASYLPSVRSLHLLRASATAHHLVRGCSSMVELARKGPLAMFAVVDLLGRHEATQHRRHRPMEHSRKCVDMVALGDAQRARPPAAFLNQTHAMVGPCPDVRFRQEQRVDRPHAEAAPRPAYPELAWLR